MAGHKYTSDTAAKAGAKGKRGSSKETEAIRSAFSDLLDENMPKVQDWLNTIAKDDPKGALDMVLKMAEYCLPKLQRTEAIIEQKNNTIQIKYLD